MKANPKISVVMSVFNGQRYLREAIDSILAQTMTDFEFIIIDDGSTDNTAGMIKLYKDPRIRVVRHENKGLAASLNIGLNLAKAEIIARMDADDIALPDRFKTQIEEYARLGEPDVLGGHVEYISETGHILGSRQQPVVHEDIVERLETRRCGTPIIHPTVFLKRASVIRHGGYDESFCHASEDYDLWLRMSRDCRFANTKRIVLRLRLHTQSMESRITKTDIPSRTSGSWWVCVARQRYFLEKEGAGNLWNDDATRERILDLLWPRFIKSGLHKSRLVNRSLALIHADLKTPGRKFAALSAALRLCLSMPFVTARYLLLRRQSQPRYLSAREVAISLRSGKN